jgi:hypothetical protein
MFESDPGAGGKNKVFVLVRYDSDELAKKPNDLKSNIQVSLNV